MGQAVTKDGHIASRCAFICGKPAYFSTNLHVTVGFASGTLRNDKAEVNCNAAVPTAEMRTLANYVQKIIPKRIRKFLVGAEDSVTGNTSMAGYTLRNIALYNPFIASSPYLPYC